MSAALPAGGCRVSLGTVAYPSLAENDAHASAMIALVNRIMSPPNSLTLELSLGGHATVGLHQPWLCDRA
jgi:hypothetical protein